MERDRPRTAGSPVVDARGVGPRRSPASGPGGELGRLRLAGACATGWAAPVLRHGSRPAGASDSTVTARPGREPAGGGGYPRPDGTSACPAARTRLVAQPALT